MSNEELFLKNLEESRKTVDKELLVLATAALGFSVYFVKTIGEKYAIDYLWILLMGCWAFGLAIISTLVSHVSCERHCSFAYDYISTGNEDAKKYYKAMFWNRITFRLNFLSLLLLSIGIIFFLIYATLTFYEMRMSYSDSNKAHTTIPSVKQTVEKGYVSPSSALQPPASPQNGGGATGGSQQGQGNNGRQ